MKPLDQHFADTMGQLTVQNTLLRAQLEQLQEQYETATKRVNELVAKYEPTEKVEEKTPEAA